MHWLEQELRRELGRKDKDALAKLKRGDITIADGFVILGHNHKTSQTLEQLVKTLPDEPRGF